MDINTADIRGIVVHLLTVIVTCTLYNSIVTNSKLGIVSISRYYDIDR